LLEIRLRKTRGGELVERQGQHAREGHNRRECGCRQTSGFDLPKGFRGDSSRLCDLGKRAITPSLSKLTAKPPTDGQLFLGQRETHHSHSLAPLRYENTYHPLWWYFNTDIA
jgi:hypothetical protein